ncbi:MAG: TIGR03086 family metal-binding protein [Candidatus Saccharimonadales bacterium]
MKKLLFETALDAAEDVMRQISPNMVALPTPCAEWNLQQLLNHLYNELAWVPELLAGKTIKQVGDALDGDLVGDDPQHTWRAYADAARAATQNVPPEKVVHLSYGNVPAADYLNEMAGEVVVHVWDVAQAIGHKFTISEELAEEVYEQTKNKAAEWRKLGLLGEPKLISPVANTEAKLLSLFGR